MTVYSMCNLDMNSRQELSVCLSTSSLWRFGHDPTKHLHASRACFAIWTRGFVHRAPTSCSATLRSRCPCSAQTRRRRCTLPQRLLWRAAGRAAAARVRCRTGPRMLRLEARLQCRPRLLRCWAEAAAPVAAEQALALPACRRIRHACYEHQVVLCHAKHASLTFKLRWERWLQCFRPATTSVT